MRRAFGEGIERWLQAYSQSHRHPVNRACHAIGIPLIASSVPVFGAALFARRFWALAGVLFAIGWVLQLVGHCVEGKPPAVLRDWRFLFVALYWWRTEIRAPRANPCSAKTPSGRNR